MFCTLTARRALRGLGRGLATKVESTAETATAEQIMEEDIKTVQQSNKELQDLYRRALADAENIRQRSNKQVQDASDYAVQKFAKELLSTCDVLEMALEAVPLAERGEQASNKDLKNLYTGVAMTRVELLKTLKRFGIEPFDSLGLKFDHNRHNALFTSPVKDKPDGTVFHVSKAGYVIRDRILRPAHVGVVKQLE